MNIQGPSRSAKFTVHFTFCMLAFAVCTLLYMPCLRAESNASALGIRTAAITTQIAALQSKTTSTSPKSTSPLDDSQPLFDKFAQVVQAAPSTAAAPQAMDPALAAQLAVDTQLDPLLWGLLGVLLGLIGVIIAYVIPPTPPAAALIGKSADYVMIYTATYKDLGQKKQGKAAIVGCLLMTAVYTLIITASAATY